MGLLVGTLVSKPAEGSKVHPARFLLSIVGAVLLLWRSIH